MLKLSFEEPDMTKDELAAILAKHKKWVDTDGKEGQRANLREIGRAHV